MSYIQLRYGLIKKINKLNLICRKTMKDLNILRDWGIFRIRIRIIVIQLMIL